MPNALLEARGNHSTKERGEGLSGYPYSSSHLLGLYLSDQEQPHPSYNEKG
jgi:hypothetical protein